MAYATSNVVNITFSGTSATRSLTGQSKTVILSATSDCYVNFDAGAASPTNSFFVPADTQYTFPILYPKQISVIQESAGGTLSVMEFGDTVKSMKHTVKDTFNSNSNLKGEVVDTATADASLKIIVADTFASDSAIMTRVADSYSGDAIINTYHEDSFTADCDLISA